ncbi:MAG: hypothetical protein HY072_08285 [Deltaproteobacteria bacterium]|nr:hypothetical protein [Deltaproteobacteria bacterium]
MTLLHKSIKEKKYDIRILEKNLERGAVALEDIEKELKHLPDDAANAEWVSPEKIGDMIDDKIEGESQKAVGENGQAPLEH